MVKIVTLGREYQLKLRRGFPTLALGAMLLAILPATHAAAQSAPSAPAPSFEVASIKINHSASGSRHFSFSESRLRASNVEVKDLIVEAYSIQPAQLSGGPGWISRARFDINAEVEDVLVEKFKTLKPEEAREQRNLMLQSLLAERFNLKVSHATKELPIYALVVAKSGIKFQASKPDQDGSSMNSSSHGGGPVQVVPGGDDGVARAVFVAASGSQRFRPHGADGPIRFQDAIRARPKSGADVHRLGHQLRRGKRSAA